jgi:DHA2 family multidrug resistance protein
VAVTALAGAASPPAERPIHRGLIALSTVLATTLQTVDTTIANVALPHMQGSMSATQDQISWVLTSYIVAIAIMTPPTGWLAGRFGRKRLFLVSIAGFTAASMLCGAAGTLEEIVLFRLLQGAFGAAIVPLSQSILLDTYPRERHGMAMAMWGMGVMIGPIIGPTLGGFLTDNYSWRWVFYINLPVGLLAFAGLLLFVPETKRARARPFDWFGFTLLSLALGGFQMMMDRGELLGWFDAAEIVAEAVIAGLALYMFVAHIMTAEHPFLEPGLFADRNFVTGILVMFMIGVLLLSTLALLPPFLQHLLDYPVLTTGYVLAPRGFGTIIAMMINGRLVGKVSSRLLIIVGLSITAYSLHEMSQFNLDVSGETVAWTGFLQGLGLGFVFVPLSSLTFATLAQRYRTEGTSIFNLMRNIGSSIGVSIVIYLLATNMQANHAVLAEYATPFNHAFALPNIAQFWNLNDTYGLAALDAEINRQAAVIAYLDDFTFMKWITLATIPLILVLRPVRHAPTPEEEAAALE